MITMINCVILWCKAALEASWAQAELCGADPTPQEAMAEANDYLQSSRLHRRYMIAMQL